MNSSPFAHGDDIATLRESVQQVAAVRKVPRSMDIDRFPLNPWKKIGGLGRLDALDSEACGATDMG